MTNQWSGGFQGAITVSNAGDAWTSWVLKFSFPGGQAATQGWGGVWTTGSSPTVTNAAWNGAVPAGASVDLGFIGTWNGTNPSPSTFSVNGVTCTGGPPVTTPAVTTPPVTTPPVTTPPVTTPPVTTPPVTTPPPGCTATPADPKATQQAKNLLCYLYSLSGNHILSGQQETNGSENEINFVHNSTGKYPAIRGMDMCDRPGSITRAAAWWNAGGIPLFRWHTGAPATSYCNYGGTASINSTLTPGTAQYTSYLGELDAAAAALLQLQAQNVPVLWAPYHEAGGTWFWWSKEGGAQYQRLYKFQFDYFTKTKGVHNLVWLMPYDGSPSSAFYPGKAYVDVGGADTYVSDHGPLTSLFNSTKAIVGTTIPIALHENGGIPDPAQLQSSGTRWVLFNTWNSNWILSQDPAFLRTTYTSSYVVTRDEVPNLR